MLSNKALRAIILDEYGRLDTVSNWDGDGICRNCGNIQSSVELDAEHYTCDECGASEVFGIDLIVLMVF